MRDDAYEAEFTLYPDPDAPDRFMRRGEYVAGLMRERGVVPILDGTRETLKGTPLGDRFGAIRSLFEEGYGVSNSYGEAFEDGTLVGSLIASRTLSARLMPKLVSKIDTFVEECESVHYGHPSAQTILFSESRMRFINAIQEEGMKNYIKFHEHTKPIAAAVTITKYHNDTDYIQSVGQGIGFVLAQLEWAYADDFSQFAQEYGEAQRTLIGRVGLSEELARQALRHISQHTYRQP